MKANSSCCAPVRSAISEPERVMFTRVGAGSTEGMNLVPGGEFLMGTDGDYGFAADGEGPMHAVRLESFFIDATCVTNEQFNAFVNATHYKTEAERFGWSFVFYGHLTAKQQETAV